MIVYFDTSAILPLVVEEPGTPVSTYLWEEADEVVSTRLIIVEAAAALAKSVRVRRHRPDDLPDLLEEARLMIADTTLIDVASDVVDRAADLAVARGLRGYDAVHLATATKLRARDLVFATGDQKLLTAAEEEGLTVVDTSGGPPVGN